MSYTNDCPVKFGVSLPGKYDLTDKVSYTLGKPNEIWHFLHCSILHGILMCHILNDCQVKCGVSFPASMTRQMKCHLLQESLMKFGIFSTHEHNMAL